MRSSSWRRRPSGLTCFLLPRVLPDGTRNALRIQRLKDKLGNRSNASSEIELDGALALRVGDEGRGVATIIEMVNHTRLDCVGGSAALMRQAFAQAAHHARHRRAFGARLVDQPLMRNVLADLALESEAATTLLLRLARAVDAGGRDPSARRPSGGSASRSASTGSASARRSTTGEAMECLGGNGYVEESIMPRLYREAPINSIWEGSGNVNALDLLRALAKAPASLDAYLRRGRARRAAPTRGSTAPPPACARRSPPTAASSKAARAGWSSGWRWCCKRRCWCATRRRRWPTRSAPRGWAARAASPSARCRPAPTRARSSTAPGRTPAVSPSRLRRSRRAGRAA